MRINQLQVGDIILEDGVAPISDIIEDVQSIKNKDGARWTHASIVDEISSNGNVWLSESIEHGICRTNLQEKLNKNAKLLVCRLKNYDLSNCQEEMVKISTKYINHSQYWYAGLINQLVMFVFGKSNFIKPKKNKFICSMWCIYKYWLLTGNLMFKNYAVWSPLFIYMAEDMFNKYELVYYASEIDYKFNEI